MARIEFVWDEAAVQVFEQTGPVLRALRSAMKKAGGDALRSMRAEAKRRVRSKRKIRAGYLANSALPLTFPRTKKLNEMVWTMQVSGREVPLGEFPARQTREGVRVEVEVGVKRLIKSAFMAKRRSGVRKGVFLRPTAERYPMGHRLGPNVASTLEQPEQLDPTLEHARTRFRSAFARLMPLELTRFRK